MVTEFIGAVVVAGILDLVLEKTAWTTLINASTKSYENVHDERNFYDLSGMS